MTTSANSRWPLIFISLALTLGAGYSSWRVTETYYRTHAFDPDPVEGLVHNIHVHKQLHEKGTLSVFLDELKNNPKNPFTILPLILVPASLHSKEAHLFITLPLMFVLLALMGSRILKQGGGLLYAAAVMFSFSTCLVIFVPYYGIGFHMPDAMASYPLAIAAVALMNWSDSKKDKWLIIFGVAISMAVLTRYIFSVYAFVIFSPVLLYYLFSEYKKSRSVVRSVVRPALLIVAPVILLCGYFVIKNYGYNVGYYSYWAGKKAVTLNYDLGFSLKTFLQGFGGFFGPFHALILAGIFSRDWFCTWKVSRRWISTQHLASLWFCIALPLFWVVVLKSNGLKVTSSFLAAFPLTFISLVSSGALTAKVTSAKTGLLVSTGIIVLSMASFLRYEPKAMEVAATPAPEVRERKVAISQLVSSLHQSVPGEIRLADFSGAYVSEAIMAELFYTYGTVADHVAATGVFRSGEQFWFENYPDMEEPDVAQRVFDKLLTTCNVAIVLKDAEMVKERNFEAAMAFRVAKDITTRLKASEKWTRVDVPTPDGKFAYYLLK